MIIVIDHKSKKAEIDKLLKKATDKKRIGDKKRFFGKIKWDEDPLAYQKRLRDEWT